MFSDESFTNENAETYSLLWLDAKIRFNDESFVARKQQLRAIINHLRTFKDNHFYERHILNVLTNDRLILIISDHSGREVVPRIHHLQQVSSIYIHCKDRTCDNQWVASFSKIKAVAFEFDELIHQIRLDERSRLQVVQSLSINIFEARASVDESVRRRFFQFQQMIDDYLQMTCSVTNINELVSFCKSEYQDNSSQLAVITEFERNYSSANASWWYTEKIFVYDLLNKALRAHNIKMLDRFHFFIQDIQHQLNKYQCKFPIRVYRSQLLAINQFENLQRRTGMFLYSNSYLSATVDQDLALLVLKETIQTQGFEKVLFEIDANPRLATKKPFAIIDSHNYSPNKSDVLFMAGSMFRLVNTYRSDDIWIVQMALCSDHEYNMEAASEYVISHQITSHDGQIKQLGVDNVEEENMSPADKCLANATSDYSNITIKDHSLHPDINKHCSSIQEYVSEIEGELSKSGITTTHHGNLLLPEICFQVQNTPTNSVLVRFAPACCTDLIGLTLMNKDLTIVNQDTLKNPSSSVQRNIDVLIYCLDINSSILTMMDGYAIQMFDDECDCISSILSVSDKLIYLVLSAAIGELVIPLIHNYRCIEQIYILDTNQESTSAQNYTKNRGTWPSIDPIVEELTQDVEAMTKRPCRWSRSRDLFAELTSQSMQNESDIMPYSINIKRQGLNSLSIVTLYYGNCRSFQFLNDQMDIYEFDDIKHCSNFIADNQTSSTIFLVISMNSPLDIQSLIKLSAVHAVYIVSDTISYDLLKIVSSSKISGLFAQYDELLVQLVIDICFYRQMTFHIPKMSVCTTQANIFEQPDKHRIEFLRLQLFIDIIDDLRFLSDDQFAFAPYHDNNQQLYLPINKIETSVIINQLFKQSVFNVLMKSSFQLSNIERLLESIPKTTNASSVTLYRAQLLSEEYLQMIRDNPNFLFKIHTVIMASRSFQTVSTICRRAVDNGLPVAMLEIVIPEKTSLTNLDASIVIFRLGAVFRLISIDLTPNGVYYIQLKLDDTAMQHIKVQIQAKIGEHPTWLTYGNCLAALKQFDTARDYYHYILRFLPLGHRSNAAICNNMGLIYSAMNKHYEDLKALELLNIARCLVIIGTWALVEPDELDKIEAERLQSKPTIRIQVKRKIDEVQTLLEQLMKTDHFESKHELI